MIRSKQKPMPFDQRDSIFKESVEREFFFLYNYNFVQIKSDDSCVSFKRDNVVVSVFYGRQSYEVSLIVDIDGSSYSMSEIVRASAPMLADQFRNRMATNAAKVKLSVRSLAGEFREFGKDILSGNSTYYNKLLEQKRQWSHDFALDVLASQHRADANAAFRERRYNDAVQLFSQYRDRLTDVERAKYRYALRRLGGAGQGGTLSEY